MIDKFLVLLERFVEAHELIAKNNGGVAVQSEKAETRAEDTEKQPAKAKRAPAKKAPAKEEAEDADDEPEEKPKRGRSKAAAGQKDARAEIEKLAKAVIDGDSDDCIDDFDDLLEEFDAKTVKDIAEDDLEDFLKELQDVVAKYYE